MPTENPYHPPTDLPPESMPGHEESSILVADFTEDTRGNIGLTSKIVKIAAVCSAVATLSHVMQIWAIYRYYRDPGDSTPLNAIIYLRIVYAPCWFLLAWMLWRYGKSLDRLKTKGIRDVEATIEQQAKLWLAIGLLLFITLVSVAFTLGRFVFSARR